MAFFYYSFLSFYTSSITLTMLILAQNWNRIKYSSKINPKILVTVIYAVNFLIVALGFKMPFTYHLLLNIFLMVCLYIGKCFSIIGLTGGIATGKSTVSQILAENGFDIIDLDKIAKDVKLPISFSFS